MELMTKALRKQLPKLYSTETQKVKKVAVKFFAPWSNWTWYAVEGDPEDDDIRFFGYVIGHENEWGYFMLSELQSVQGPFGLKIERDRHFDGYVIAGDGAISRGDPTAAH